VTIAKVDRAAVDDPTDNVPACPSGHQCAYSDANFGGYVISRPRCVYLDYFTVFFYNHEGDMDDWAFDVSAVYNNIPGVTWSQFWSPRNNANYNAYYRSPAAYVGDKWNDSFTAAQGCSGQAQ
jgi:Peptidase inhibitor family I36